MTKLKLNKNTITKNQIYAEGTQEDPSPVVSPGSSPSPPESPHSPAAVPHSPSLAELPELPEIITLCERLTPSIDDLNKKKLTTPEFMNILVQELKPLIQKHLAPKKTAKKKRDREPTVRRCSICKTESTPEWRRDPEGLMTLCNACGLKEKKRAKSNTTPNIPTYNSQRFHSTVWTHQYPPTPQTSARSTQNSTAGIRQQQGPSAHFVPLASVPQQSPQHAGGMHQNGAPVYHSFQLKPLQTYKNEENNNCGVYQNQRYLNSAPIVQPSLPTYNQSTYYPLYNYNEDSYGYGPSPPMSYHNHLVEDDLHHNCPQCPPYYPPNQY
jgi:hypothetical protein